MADLKPTDLTGEESVAFDVAYASLFLASEEASFLTGQVLLVDGGVSLSLT